jgi:hypothetical protein
MMDVLAHITHQEMPGFWLAALAGFVGGVAVTLAMLASKVK